MHTPIDAPTTPHPWPPQASHDEGRQAAADRSQKPRSMGGNVAEGGGKKSVPFPYTWKLERLSSSAAASVRSWVYSDAFLAGGYNWKLALNLGEAKVIDGKGYLSLFLAPADDSPLPSPLVIEVIHESSIVDEKYSQYNKRKVVHRLPESKSEDCCPFLMSLETLECPSSGFLVVEIIDVIIHSERNDCLSPKLERNSVVYTWKIDGFSKLAREKYMSGPFLHKDHIWYLSLYPKGSHEDRFMSLYLHLDDAGTLSPSVKVYVEEYFDCVDQINGKDHRCRGYLVFDSKSSARGYSKFLSLGDLHEPSKGFLVNDTCIIKVGFMKCEVS